MADEKPTTSKLPKDKMAMMQQMMRAHIASYEAMTDEDHRAAARERLAVALPTYLESLPSSLEALSVPQVRVELSDTETDAVIAAFGGNGAPTPDEVKEISRVLGGLAARLDSAAAGLPRGGFFVRLSSRSPKDSWLGQSRGFRLDDGAGAIDLLCDSERVWEDLRRDRRAGHRPAVYLRAWRHIPAWAEFRCLVADDRLIGISQSDYRDGQAWPEITQRPAAVEAAVAGFVDERVVPTCPLDRYVADVAFEGGDLTRPFLIELNPFGPGTDPALFRADNPMAGGRPSGPRMRFHGDGRTYPFASPLSTEQADAEPVEEASVPAPGGR